jgi:hypothetical protein
MQSLSCGAGVKIARFLFCYVGRFVFWFGDSLQKKGQKKKKKKKPLTGCSRWHPWKAARASAGQHNTQNAKRKTQHAKSKKAKRRGPRPRRKIFKK